MNLSESSLITYNKNDNIKTLWNKIYDALKPLCSYEYCWTELKFLNLIDDKKLKQKLMFFTFKPRFYNNGNGWLNTDDIENVMKQYEKVYSNFYFIGAKPCDFYKYENINFSKIKKYPKVGIIFNLDTTEQSGSQWTSCFINNLSNNIYYFDSVGDKPNKCIYKFLNKLIKYNNKYTLYINNKEHQKGNRECGVYSIYFLLKQLVHNNDFEGPNSKYTKNDGSHFDDGIEGRRFVFNSRLNEKLACTRQSAVIIGSFIFVHGGIVPELAKKFKISEVNNLIRKWLLKKIDENDERIETLVSTPNQSPFWTRLFGNIPAGLDYKDERCFDSLDGVFKTWGDNNNGLKGMVIGHTPQMELGINGTCGNRLWRIDVGASKAFDVFERSKNSGRKPSVLEILNDGEDFNVLS
jgi:hypothetical protein